MSHTVRRLVRAMNARDLPSRGVPAAMRRAADLSMMRELNRLLVLNYVREQGPAARVTIAQRTGLSRTTVSSIIDLLIREGLVREGSHVSAAPTGGRRAILVQFNADAGYTLGVDVGRTHCTVIATNLAAEVVARHSGPFHADLGPSVCLPQLVEELRAFVASANITWDHVVGIGVGIPGPVDARLRMLITPPRMPGWHGFDLRQALRRELNVPVYLDNDANMGALGESRFGAGRGIPELAYVKVGTGIGCGLVINGSVYRGSRGSAGELGHMTIDNDGPLCDCGNRGCLEAMAGGGAIVADASGGLLGEHGGMQAAKTMSRTASHDLDLADIVRGALDGNPACTAAIERAGNHIGVALAGLVNLFNPSVILVAGGVAGAGEILLQPIRNAIATRSLSAASANTTVMTAALGDTAIALGAAATVIDAAFGEPSVPTASAGEGTQPQVESDDPASSAVRRIRKRAEAITRP